MTAGVGAEAASEAEAAGVVGGDAGDEGQELDVVAAVELELGGLSAGDDAADFTAGSFNVGCIGTNGDAFADGTDFELDVGGDFCVYFYTHVFTDVLLEACGSCFDVVETDRDAGDGVGTVFVDSGFAFKASGRVADSDFRAADGEAGWVANDA